MVPESLCVIFKLWNEMTGILLFNGAAALEYNGESAVSGLVELDDGEGLYEAASKPIWGSERASYHTFGIIGNDDAVILKVVARGVELNVVV